LLREPSWVFRLDVHGEKTLQERPILRHNPISLIRKDSELPLGIDGKVPLLFPPVKRTVLKKRLDVLPAKRLFGQGPAFPLALKIVTKARNKKIFFISELGIQP
jgi:hypothetical protein